MASILQTTAKVNGDNVQTLQITLTGVTAGSRIVVPIAAKRTGGASGTITVSDDVDGTYTKDATATQGNTSSFIFSKVTTVGGTHVITIDGVLTANFFTAAALEISAGSRANLRAQVNSGALVTTLLTSVIGTALAESVLVAVCAFATSTSVTVQSTSPAWTELFEETNNAAHAPGEADYKILSSDAVADAQWTLGSGSGYTACYMSYAPAADSGSGGSLAWTPLTVLAGAGAALVRSVLSGSGPGRG